MTKIFTIAANEIIGPFSTETTMLQFEYDSEKTYSTSDVLTQVRNAVKSYLDTEEGKKTLRLNSGYFNWGDAAEIPDGFYESFGLKKLDAPVADLTVDFNEDLTADEISDEEGY